MTLSQVAKRQCPGSEVLVSTVGSDVVLLPALAYVYMKSFCTKWRVDNDEATAVPAAAECPSVGVLEMNNLAVLLKKDAGWTQDVVSVDLRLVEIRGLYHGEHTALKLSAGRTHYEVVKNGRGCCRLILRSGPVVRKPNLDSVKHMQHVRRPMRSWRGCATVPKKWLNCENSRRRPMCLYKT